MMDYPADIVATADCLANSNTGSIKELIAYAMLLERTANLNEIEKWRNRWRNASFSLDASSACADYARKYLKEITGTTCTWVDDDVKVLAHLADKAVTAGLTTGLPQTIIAAIAAKKVADRALEENANAGMDSTG